MRLGRALRDRVVAECEALNGTTGFPLIIAGASFGAGSFGRKTHPQPLDDIDLYLVLNAGGAVLHDEGTTFALEGNTQGPFIDDWALRAGQWISADLVLARFAAYLPQLPTVRQIGATTGINTKAQSAFIKWPARGINIDLSPVVWTRRTDLDRYCMPEGHGSYAWKATNPKADQKRISDQNQAQAGLPLPAIRMLKWWNAHQNGDRLKGIHLEVMAERAMAGYQLDGVAQALHAAFYHMTAQLQGNCPDPTGLGPNLDVRLGTLDRQKSIEAANYAEAAVSLAAENVSTGDVANALQFWDLIFPGLSTS